MRSARIAYLGIIISILAAVFVAPGHSLAQSTIDLVMHYVESAPVEGKNSYLVDVHFSVVDNAGSPVGDIQNEFLTATEDSQNVSIQNLVRASDEPINIVIVLDTSGTMAGTAITDTKAALDIFINGLKANDQVAIISFDDLPRPQVDFTTDRNVITKRLEMITPTKGTGRCLYDAAYMGVQLASSRPSGSRAVILFTNGVDQTLNGAICSVHNADDVINLASQGRTPVYTLAMGERVDAKMLKRISDLTGGFHLATTRSSKLGSLFQLLSSQLRSRYILTYESLGQPGTHILTLQVNYFGAQDIDTRNFLLPTLPPLISFTTPQDGEVIGDQMNVVVAVIPRGQPVVRLSILLNDSEVGSIAAPPYEWQLNMQPYAAGNYTLAAVAHGAADETLASSSMSLVRLESALIPSAVPPQPESSPPVAAPEQSVQPVVVLGISLGVLGITIITLLIFKLVRQSGLDQAEENAEITFPSQYQLPVRGAIDNTNSDRPRNHWAVDTDVLGTLTVLESDDPSMKDQPFDIFPGRTTIGRSIENNINFPNDKPVSRHHAEIFEKDGRLYLQQVRSTNASGEQTLPRFGTFVNDTSLGLEAYPLHHGDLIVLGKRLQLRMDIYEKKNPTSEELTSDDMATANDSDETNDQQALDRE